MLVAAAALPELVRGVALLNTAGQFGDAINENTESQETPLQKFILKPLKEIFQRIVLGFLFWQAKQPARVQSVLKSVCQSSFPLFRKSCAWDSFSSNGFICNVKKFLPSHPP